LHLVGILFPHINDDAQSKSHQISVHYLTIQFDTFSCYQRRHQAYTNYTSESINKNWKWINVYAISKTKSSYRPTVCGFILFFYTAITTSFSYYIIVSHVFWHSLVPSSGFRLLIWKQIFKYFKYILIYKITQPSCYMLTLYVVKPDEALIYTETWR